MLVSKKKEKERKKKSPSMSSFLYSQNGEKVILFLFLKKQVVSGILLLGQAGAGEKGKQ